MDRPTHPCFVNAIPKGGTHLGYSLLALLGYSRLLAHGAREGDSFSGVYEGLIRPDGTLSIPADELGRLERCAGVVQAASLGLWSLRAATLDRMRPNHMLDGHLLYVPACAETFGRSPCKMLLILRDPRGVAVSQAHSLAGRGAYSGMPADERIRRALLGDFRDGRCVGGNLPLLERYRNMVNWQAHDSVLCVRFEDLVGARGGGDSRRQTETLRRVLAHLGFPRWSTPRVEALGSELFGGTETFRAGQVEGWREHEEVFSEPRLAEAVEEILALLDTIGRGEQLAPAPFTSLGRSSNEVARIAPHRVARHFWSVRLRLGLWFRKSKRLHRMRRRARHLRKPLRRLLRRGRERLTRRRRR